MRLIRLKLGEATLAYTRERAKAYRIADAGFVADLYAFGLLKGAGLPDDARLKSLIEHYKTELKVPELLVSSMLKKRLQLLKAIGGTLQFRFYAHAERVKELVEVLLRDYMTVYTAVRQATCVACSLRKDCELGKTYGVNVASVKLLIVPDYAAKVHPSCPERPVLDAVNQLAVALEAAHEVSENAAAVAEPAQAKAFESATAEAEAAQRQAPLDSAISAESLPLNATNSPASWLELQLQDSDIGLPNYGLGQGGGNGTAFDGARLQVDPSFISSLSVQKWLLWEVSRKLASKLLEQHAGKLKPSSETTKEKAQATIKSAADVTRVVASEHAKGSSAFYSGVARKSLVKRESLTGDKKKHLIYLLLDTSASMSSIITARSGLWAIMSRAGLATAFSLALIELLRHEQGIAYFRTFDAVVGPLMAAESDEELKRLGSLISRCSFSGSGTEILASLSVAIADIAAAKSRLREAEILLITDCGSFQTPEFEARVAAKLKASKVALNTLTMISHRDLALAQSAQLASSSVAAHIRCPAFLLRESDRFFNADGSTTLDKLVSLVGGKQQ